MTKLRKKSLKKLLIGLIVYSAISVYAFFIFFGFPPIAMAIPAVIWTFYGFNILHFITQTDVDINWKLLSSGMNGYLILSSMFFFPWVFDKNEVPDTIQLIGIICFFIFCIAEVVFWILFIKKHHKIFKINFHAKDE